MATVLTACSVPVDDSSDGEEGTAALAKKEMAMYDLALLPSSQDPRNSQVSAWALTVVTDGHDKSLLARGYMPSGGYIDILANRKNVDDKGKLLPVVRDPKRLLQWGYPERWRNAVYLDFLEMSKQVGHQLSKDCRPDAELLRLNTDLINALGDPFGAPRLCGAYESICTLATGEALWSSKSKWQPKCNTL
jgi:hypothetical protein